MPILVSLDETTGQGEVLDCGVLADEFSLSCYAEGEGDAGTVVLEGSLDNVGFNTLPTNPGGGPTQFDASEGGGFVGSKGVLARYVRASMYSGTSVKAIVAAKVPNS